ncbi:MAG: hypothetical protein V3T11_09970 [Roseateles sp.]
MKMPYPLLYEPLHDDTYPLPLGWDEFIGGEGKHTRTKVLPVIHTSLAARMTPNTDKLLARVGDGYRIYAARYSLNPERHAAEVKKRGPGVVAMIEDLHVGSLRKHFMWTHRDHRRQAVGLELCVLFLLYYGYETWTFKQGIGYRMTDAVVALRRKQYDIMVERGIVVNVDEATDAD